MDLLRLWRRHLVGGAAAAVVVPAAIVGAALSVGILGGGIGGLGSLAQTVTGPDPSALDAVAAQSVRAGDEAARLLGRESRRGSRGDGRSGAPSAGDRDPRRGDPSADRTPRRPGDGDTRGPRPARPPSPPPAGGPPMPPSQPPPPPSTIRRVGDSVKEVTSQVPVAGEPAGEVVDQIVTTAESLPLP